MPLDSRSLPAKDALVLFMPSGRRGRFTYGTPVLEAARSLGVFVESVCGGRGICGRCQVLPAMGHFAKHGIEAVVLVKVPETYRIKHVAKHFRNGLQKHLIRSIEKTDFYKFADFSIEAVARSRQVAARTETQQIKKIFSKNGFKLALFANIKIHIHYWIAKAVFGSFTAGMINVAAQKQNFAHVAIFHGVCISNSSATFTALRIPSS